jgi:hypothetical protein
VEPIVIDDFLDDFASFRDHMHKADYTGVVNPVDLVTYPDCTYDIPIWVKAQIVQKISAKMGGAMHPLYGFVVRLTSDITQPAPHQAHTDSTMAEYVALLHINPGVGGTELIHHVHGNMHYNPETEDELAIWDRDKNDEHQWVRDAMVDIEPNRLVIIETQRMHRAWPIHGFGSGPEDGRLVLISFFNVIKGG